MIAIIDYGMGNLRSVQKALEKVGAQAFVTQNKNDITSAQKVILPGVGAMRPAMERLEQLDLVTTIQKITAQGKPFLGICLGLQLLFEKSNEGGEVNGLGVLPGEVVRFTSQKVPHMGWNQIGVELAECPLFKNLDDKPFVYFCHSYFVKPRSATIVATSTDYGIKFTSSIWDKNIFGVQFHPEKSQTIGLNILKNFVNL